MNYIEARENIRLTGEGKGVILDLCGGTGSWSKPFSDAGYDVFVITLPEYDVTDVIFRDELIGFVSVIHTLWIDCTDVVGILAAPPCTMFSFARTRGNITSRDLEKGMRTVKACLDIIWYCQAKLENQYSQKPTLGFWALENPNGHLKYFLGKPSFEFDPYEFGDIYSKKTHLWGWFNDPIKTHTIDSRVQGKKFDQLLMSDLKSIDHSTFRDTKNRQALRSITPAGFAKAFFKANQP